MTQTFNLAHRRLAGEIYAMMWCVQSESCDLPKYSLTRLFELTFDELIDLRKAYDQYLGFGMDGGGDL